MYIDETRALTWKHHTAKCMHQNFKNKLEWCAFALKDEHNVYSLVPNIAVCMYNLFLFFLQNGCRRPFWMSEIHFGSHFWPFRSIQIFYFFGIFFTKWLPVAILDVRKSLSISFLSISHRCATLISF